MGTSVHGTIVDSGFGILRGAGARLVELALDNLLCVNGAPVKS